MVPEVEGMRATDALSRLQDGNVKFVAATLTGLNGEEPVARRTELMKDQKPLRLSSAARIHAFLRN